jgi:hypothetical protein
MKKITGVLIDVERGTAAITTLEDNLQTYYKALNCDLIDIVARSVAGTPVEIVYDDEGLLKNFPKISAINDMGDPMFCGSLFIVGPADEEGNLTSLTNDDAERVMQQVYFRSTRNWPIPYPMLHQCEYC